MTLLTYAPKSTQCSLNKIFFISRTDMQLDEGFWMRWSDNFGRTFDGGRVVIPVRKNKRLHFLFLSLACFLQFIAGSTYEIYFVFYFI